MARIKRSGNRLSIGSWSMPFAPSDVFSKRASRNLTASLPKDPGNDTASERSTAKRTGPEAADRTLAAKPMTNGPEIKTTNQAGNAKPIVGKLETETAGRRSMAKPTTNSLVQLAAVITRETEKLDRYIRESGAPAPSFDIDGPLDFPKLPDEIKAAREEVVRATKELGDLVTGPKEGVRWLAWGHNNSLSLHGIYHYRIAKSFPVGETASYAQIAEKVGLDEGNVRRFIRHAMTNRIFWEVDPDTVAHTAASRVLAEDVAMDDWVGFCVEDMFPATSQTVSALKSHPSADEPTRTGFCVANNTADIEPMFATFSQSPARAKRFGGAMASLTGGVGYELSHLLSMYPWAALPRTATIVDMGGSHGFVCIELAKHNPEMRFIVQDLPKMIASAPAPAELDAHVRDRVTFQAHDFFTEQPVKGADVYLFRWILHNHSDKYSVKMLRALIPALKKGARVVINDHVLREGFDWETLWDEKIIRTMDLVMLTLLNAKERDEAGFRTLFGLVDSRFRFVGVRREEGCRMGVVEAVWEGEDFGGSV
ncbi:O-methyltransferase [Lachnellula hyalina]|uniref:O-methyltransferase n=1 Tax=Lachnellula hyalina TaxID=1316788 RepID=A0A8H8R1R5_9HELO|nr:O-methyltransferase [Lachnellula hyalina]TVY26927.1 O-methyltransferase [Lachnellula hyalina]